MFVAIKAVILCKLLSTVECLWVTLAGGEEIRILRGPN